MATVTEAPDRRRRLTERMAGAVVGPEDEGYEALRRVHNGLIDRHPMLIARCRGTADVAEAVRFAAAEGLELAVRGGGHSPAGRAVADDGLVVDLSDMRGVDVDPEARIARVQGGALWQDVNRETAVHGLAVTGGAVSTTGVGGYTLGGGLGWLMGLHGLAADNLLEAEVVLASGDVVRAGPDRHDDLFWALRGGGGNFGVVTSFAFRLHPHATVVGGLVLHPIDAAADLLRLYRDAAAGAPDELGLFAGLLHAPDGSGVPLAGLLVCHAGAPDEAEQALRPLVGWGDPAMVQVGPLPYWTMNTLLDDAFPKGALNYWKSTFVRGVSDGLIETLVERFALCPSPMSGMLLEHFHGAVTRIAPTATAVPHRQPGFNLLIPSVWTDPATTEENLRWTRATYDAVAPYRARARWLNYFDDDEDDDALTDAYGPNAARLAEVKRRYDPANLFRHNQNIVPAAA